MCLLCTFFMANSEAKAEVLETIEVEILQSKKHTKRLILILLHIWLLLMNRISSINAQFDTMHKYQFFKDIAHMDFNVIFIKYPSKLSLLNTKSSLFSLS